MKLTREEAVMAFLFLIDNMSDHEFVNRMELCSYKVLDGNTDFSAMDILRALFVKEDEIIEGVNKLVQILKGKE